MTVRDSRADAYRQHLVDFTDDDGLVASELCADGPRLFVDADFDGCEKWSLFADDYPAFMTYEDAIMTTGRFIQAEALRCCARERTDELSAARRSAEALLQLSAIGDRTETGLLPKPHGGMGRAADARGISCDQYEHALFGLWALRSSVTDTQLVGRIERVIVRWADFALRRDFAFDYFGRMTSVPEEAVHSLGLFLPLMLIARRITSDSRYTDAADRRLGAIIHGALVEGVNPSGATHPNIVNLIMMGVVYCWRHDYHRDACEKAVHAWGDHALSSLSADGLAYEYPEGSDDAPAQPRYISTANMNLNYKFMAWRSNVKGAGSCKTAHTLAVAYQVYPSDQWRETARRILQRFERVTDFLRYDDPDRRQIPDEFRYLRRCLPNQLIGAWLIAHYLIERPALYDRIAP